MCACVVLLCFFHMLRLRLLLMVVMMMATTIISNILMFVWKKTKSLRWENGIQEIPKMRSHRATAKTTTTTDKAMVDGGFTTEQLQDGKINIIKEMYNFNAEKDVTTK